ncbi:acyltransferase [Saccharospirillum sp. MSK14-1]|uniref:acyltransferase n=1 Tax=Saccharospirillum sp. MSK14-1 TaxID=1897632 RepID=UPI000D3B1E4E|nr:acyltransferase [Saccharospirillum sp. MSK14-1]PTY36154.1 acyltransferase [Saccharospirillum sp. MSK14-1]
MIRNLLSNLHGALAAIALVVHTLTLGVFLYLFIALRAIIRFRATRPFFQRALTGVASIWMAGIQWWMRTFHRTRWQVEGLGQLNPKGWYLITANHQSWADIFVLFRMYNRKIPLLKFFIKKDLMRVPVAGQAWWALDFPFMQRHSKSYLKKHPEKAGQDLEATKKACERFSETPTSVMNFIEGTRFSQAKHDNQKSPYKHLLKPKAGGLAFTIAALGNKFSALTNVTIAYPAGAPSFWDLMCGRMREVIVQVEELAIPAHFTTGDYQNDPSFRVEFQAWITQLWERKDQLLDEILSNHPK